MKTATPTNDTEQQRRREATRLLTLRYLAMKESRRDVMDMLVEDRAESIMEQVRERLASAAGRYDGKTASGTTVAGCYDGKPASGTTIAGCYTGKPASATSAAGCYAGKRK